MSEDEVSLSDSFEQRDDKTIKFFESEDNGSNDSILEVTQKKSEGKATRTLKVTMY